MIRYIYAWQRPKTLPKPVRGQSGSNTSFEPLYCQSPLPNCQHFSSINIKIAGAKTIYLLKIIRCDII
ncbi:hypothetical protein DNU06_04300 [Putridiphycobacter roseus]|uniref:Uncharacterized protein n=1 Tax=Putridiphycobacter roseus TaxID=2219161 RepID=A0A2W1NIS1_9FLAO|nr:hypothetical protein DNU06_04300 [Putridiphycobacter roseus]